MRRICSRPTDYQQHVEELKGHLVRRGYNGKKVQQSIDKATRMTRQESLTQQEKESKQITPLVVTFHPDLPHLSSILHDHQCIIDISTCLKGAFPRPPLVAYHRPPNLKDLLVRAAYGQQKETYRGNSQCKHPCCKACDHIKTGRMINSTTTGKQFHVKATTDCRTRMWFT